jgi:hypothetical protein
MSLTLKKLIGLLFGIAAIESASAFSMYGPAEPWQNGTKNFVERWFYGDVIRADSSTFTFAFDGVGPPSITFGGTTDLGGSKNLGDEYRLNTPTITYAFDSSFLSYFGANGVRAVDQAMSILNHLPKVSKASSDLTEFLTDDNQRINQRAQALNLIDLKSVVLSIMLERYGLLGETHVFDLHERISYPGTCNFDYVVVPRNFDPLTREYSHYVNGVLYTYQVVDLCPGFAEADALESKFDPTGLPFTAVATQQGLVYGGYYLGITRDDVGGLRYMYRHDHLINELLPANSFSQGFLSPFTPVGIIGTNGIGTNSVATNSPTLRGGIEKVKFVKKHFNSLFGTVFKTNVVKYTLPAVFDNTVKNESIVRLLTRPDIVFAAADLSAGLFYPAYRRTTPDFLTVSNSFSSGAGPGVLSPQAVVTFNKVGPVLLNATPFFLDEITATKGFLWGSFDGSTNDPIIYPQGTSIREIEARVLRR